MTSPLPNSPSRVEQGTARTADSASFFAPRSSTPARSFDSLIPKNDPKKSSRKEAEEAEEAATAKKRKNTPQPAAAFATPQPDQAAPTALTPTLAPGETPEAPLDTAAELSSVTDPLSQPTPETADLICPSAPGKPAPAPTTDSGKIPALPETAETLASSAEKNSVAPAPDSGEPSPLPPADDTAEGSLPPLPSLSADIKTPTASGMESATSAPEMISLEAIDGMEAASASARGSEPSITSANRLVQMSDAEHSSPEAITSSSSTSDSSLGNLASGNAAPLTPLSNQTPATPTAHAASVLKTLAPELEKLHQSGQSQMQLDLPVSDTESVKIRLSIRGGELRSTFITESPELREALQKAWPEFAASNRDRGMRFGDTTFQEAAPRNETATDQGRQQRQFQPDNTASNTYRQPSVAPKATPTSAQPTAPTRPGAMNLWA